MEFPTVSVIIPTKNRTDSLRACLAPLLPEAHEVVVVMDGSNDSSEPMLQELAASHANLMVLTASGGRSGARQAGLEAATGEIALLIDDDVVAHEGMVVGHGAAQAEHSGVVVGYMPVKDPQSIFSRLYQAEYENNCRKYETGTDVLSALWGGNVSLPRQDALRIGLTSPGFERRYHEDTDFGLRCKKAELTGYFDRNLRADHHHSRALRAFLRDARSSGEGRVLLKERHGDLSEIALSSTTWHSLSGHFVVVALFTTLLAPLTRVSITAPRVTRLLRRLHRAAGEVAMEKELV